MSNDANPDLRCVYAEVPAKLPEHFITFQCQNCAKKITIPSALRDKFDEITARMPACPTLATKNKTVLKPQTPTTFTPPPPTPISELNLAGPGTQLKRLLSKVGIKSTPNCSCNARARKMDEMGVEWCEQNIDEIVGWLKEEAQKRRLPFLAFPTKILVQRAINMAKRVQEAKAAEQEKPQNTDTQ